MAILPLEPASLALAAAALIRGDLVAFPTETVYGLGADATNAHAVAKVFAAKGRPRFNPLIVHVPSLAEAQRLGSLNAQAEQLAAAFWPGPLTLVVARSEDCPVCELASAGLATVALRVPSHPIAEKLLRAAALPIAAPSANRSGHVSPTTAKHVLDDLGDEVSVILDGGPTSVGLESTIVDVTGESPVLLRAGAITVERLTEIAGRPVLRATGQGERPTSPGQLLSHYAPRARVRVDATRVEAGEALLAFGPHPIPCPGPCRNLSPIGDLVEAASNLFAYLRELDGTGASGIAVMPVPGHGLGEAINDRLQRASRGR